MREPMTKEEVVTLIEGFSDRFLMESPAYCNLDNAIRLAHHAGFSSPWDPTFQESLKQLDQIKKIYYIGKDECFFLLNEDYVLKTFTKDGTREINKLGVRLIEEIHELKKKYLG